jgi:voltage-gated potassium channel
MDDARPKGIVPGMDQPVPILSRLFLPLAAASLTVILGTLGYTLIEGWPLLDSLYMTVITLSSVGFKEVYDLSGGGRLFTIILIVAGIGILGTAVTAVAGFLLEGELNGYLRGRRMRKELSQLSGHVIVCGGGRTGRFIAEDLLSTDQSLIVIEQSDEVLDALRRHCPQVPVIVGDATQDHILRDAGIERAAGLITSLGSDKDNVFVVLSARALNPRLRIIARLDDEGNEAKLRSAGADEVVSPNALGGKRMAAFLLHPAAVQFVEMLMSAGRHRLHLEEVTISADSPLCGETLASSHIGRNTNTLVLGLRAPDGGYTFNPGGKALLEGGHAMIVMGTHEEIENLREQAGHPHGTTGLFFRSRRTQVGK